MQLAARIVLWVIALFYLYGGAVHVLNMLSQTGFDWGRAPLKWQILDVVYLVLDILVVVGFAFERRYGAIAFYVAAISQVILYSIFRDWIIDVPAEFAVSNEQRAYLTTLVWFHVATIVMVTVAIGIRSRGTTIPGPEN